MEMEIYQSLAAINESLQGMAGHLHKLRVAGILPPQFAELYRLSAEQMRAEINLMATLRLHDNESHQASCLEKLRIRQEKRINGEPIIDVEQAEESQKPVVTVHSQALEKSS